MNVEIGKTNYSFRGRHQCSYNRCTCVSSMLSNEQPNANLQQNKMANKQTVYTKPTEILYNFRKLYIYMYQIVVITASFLVLLHVHVLSISFLSVTNALSYPPHSKPEGFEYHKQQSYTCTFTLLRVRITGSTLIQNLKLNQTVISWRVGHTKLSKV